MRNAESDQYELTVNLEDQVVYDNQGFKITFDIAPYPKEMLLNGWDEIGVTLNYEDKIKEYELIPLMRKMSLESKLIFFGKISCQNSGNWSRLFSLIPSGSLRMISLPYLWKDINMCNLACLCFI